MLLLAQGMDVPRIAEVALTSPTGVRDVIHNFNRDGFEVLCIRATPVVAHLLHPAAAATDQEISLSRPTDHDLPFATWSLAKLADYLVAERVIYGHIRVRAAPFRGW